MSLNRWMLLYLVTGSRFTRRAALAFYEGGLVVLAGAVVLLAAAYHSLFNR